MTSRSSLQMEERRLLQTVNPDTLDYYDGVEGIPPPHRLSGLYPASPSLNALQESTSASQLPSNSAFSGDYHSPRASISSPRASYSTPAFDLDYPSGAMASTGSFANATSTPYLADHQPSDSDAFLDRGNMSTDRLSPAVAARERYMARKEQEHSPFYQADGSPSGTNSKRGIFAGKRKWWWLAGAILIIVIIIAAVAGSLASRGKSSSNGGGVSGVVQSDANDPSKFTKDPALKQSFYGMCYTPLNAQWPACGDTLDSVIEDIQLMSQLTTRLRLYGSDCEVPSLVLEAIQKTKVNMTVFLAAWLPQPADDPDNATYNRQVQALQKAIQTYGVDHVEGVSVGNEFLLNGGPESELITKMADMRTLLAGMNLPKTLPVGTADAGSMVTTSLSQGSDFVMANVHPWFGGVPVSQAAGWVYSYTANQEPSSALLATNNPKIYIAETGWPSGANATAFETYQGAVSGIAQLNTFLETYVCQANQNITNGGQFSNYFYFEAFDEPWKRIYGGVEEHWGLFNSNKTLKAGLTLPDCSHP